MSTPGFKLLTQRKDGTLGPLFINRKQRIPIGEWLEAESHPTKGFALRPFWHACAEQRAPHLKEEGRVWCRVELEGVEEFPRPEHQGGTWYLAQRMKVLSLV